MNPNDEPPALSEEALAAAPADDEPAGSHAAADEEMGTGAEDEDDYEGYDSDAFEGYDSDAGFEDVVPQADPVATALDAFRKEQGWLDKAGEPSQASKDFTVPFQRLGLSAPPAMLAFLHLPTLVAELVAEPSLSHADLRSLALVASPFVHPVQKHLFCHLQIDTVVQSGRVLEIFASHPALAEMCHSMELALGNVRATITEIPLIKATIESLREEQDLVQDRGGEDDGRQIPGQDATGEELDKLRMEELCDRVLRELSIEDLMDVKAYLDNIFSSNPFNTHSSTFLSYEPTYINSLSFLSKPTSIKLSFPASTVPDTFLPHLSRSLTSLTVHHPSNDSQSQQLLSASGEYTFTLRSTIPSLSLSSDQDSTIKDASTSLRRLDLQNVMLVGEGTYDQPAKWQLEECRLLGVGVRSFESSWGDAQPVQSWDDAWTGESVQEVEREEIAARVREEWGIDSEAGSPLAEVDAATSFAPEEDLRRLVSGDGDEPPPLIPSNNLSDFPTSSNQFRHFTQEYSTPSHIPNTFVSPSASLPQHTTAPSLHLSLALFLGPAHNTLRVLHLNFTAAFSDSSLLSALVAHSKTLEHLSITRRGAWQPTLDWEVGETRPVEVEGEGKRGISDFAKVLRTCGALREVRLVDEEGVPSWDADVVDALGKSGAKLEWVGVRVRADGRTGEEWREWEKMARKLAEEGARISVVCEMEWEK